MYEIFYKTLHWGKLGTKSKFHSLTSLCNNFYIMSGNKKVKGKNYSLINCLFKGYEYYFICIDMLQKTSFHFKIYNWGKLVIRLLGQVGHAMY